MRLVEIDVGEGKFAEFLLTVLAGVAKLERDILDEKRRDGIAAAKARKVKFGRPKLVSPELLPSNEIERQEERYERGRAEA